MRSRFRRSVASIGAIVVAAALVTACGGTPQAEGGASDGEPVKGGTLRVALSAQPSSLNPVLGNSGSADFIVQYPIFDTLTEYNSETGEADPRLAESWEFPDPQTFVMHLRDGVTFQDGTAVDAAAVTWFLNFARGPEGGGAQVDLAKLESVEATGDLEVTVRLSEPFSGLPWVLSGRAGMVMSQTAYESASESFAQNPVGAGPYSFVSEQKGSKIELERYEGYWDPDAIHPDEIVFTIFDEPTTIVNAIKSRQQDLSFSVSPKDVPQLQTDSQVNVTIGESYLLDQIHMNRSKAPLDDPRVREAMYFAVDREQFVEAATFGLGSPGYQFRPEGNPAASTKVAEERAHDLDRAKELLKEAGHESLSLTMITQPSEVEVRKAEVLQSQLAEAGIELQIQPMELTQAVAEMFQNESADLFFAYGVSRADVADTMNATFDVGALYNLPREEHAELMEKLREANSTSDADERNAHLQEAAEVIADQTLLLPIAFHPFIAVTAANVHGVQVDAVLKPRLDGVWIGQ